MEIRVVRAELFYANERTNGKTDMTKLTVAFRKVANAPQNNNSQKYSHSSEANITINY